MVSRPALMIVLEVALAVVLTLLLGGVVQTLLGASPAEAFLSQAPQLLFTFMDVGLVAWLALLILGAVRGRGLGWGVAGTILAALVGAIVNLAAVIVIAIAQGGANIFYIALGVEAGVLFVVSALVATLLVQRVILKPAARTAG